MLKSIDTGVIIDLVCALVAAVILSFISTPIVKSFAYKVGAIDVPKDKRRMHSHPIPRLGGLAIFVAFILSVVLFADINRQMRGILIGTVIIVIVGAIDDIVSLPAWLKLLFQILAAVVAAGSGVMINVLSNPNFLSKVEFLNLGWLSWPLTVIWIVGITNSVNLIDGLDGLAVGVSAIGGITMLVVALVLGQWNVAVVLAALVGACIGFMPYNMNPAKIFMGDTGALLLGYIMATMSVMGLFKYYAIVSFAVPLLAMGLPIFDTVFAIIRRLLKGQNPMVADRGHFHHRLIDMGLSQKQAVAVLYLISAVLGVTAVVIATGGELKALILLISLCLALGVGIFLYRSARHETGKAEKAAPPESPAGESSPAEQSGDPDAGSTPEK